MPSEHSAPDPDRWELIDRLLDEALQRPAQERRAFITDQAADPGLAQEALAMLDRLSDAESLGDSVTGYVEPLIVAGRQRVPFERVGPYRILRPLGEGGMGAVYLAERDDDTYQKQVALKLIRADLEATDFRERFLHERRVLAGLEHPNIARLLDAGTAPDGRPYLVMEYVDGLPITEFADRFRLSTDQRLALFTAVCEAVQYAHQNLIVHRDLKPANILVPLPPNRDDTTRPADLGVKLVDFGVAKQIGLADAQSPLTETGRQLLTPAYASPEQVRGGQITTASDVYQLGVLLFELLTGQRPFDVKNRLRHELLRIVLEEDPQRPSVLADDTSANRHSTTTSRLRRRLAGDLDTIVLMAMRKEPARRYTSASELADDVHRHIDGLPVRAQPDTLVYRARKFVRRHRSGVVAGAVIALLTLGLAATMTWSALETQAYAESVERERDRAEQLNDFTLSLFESADPFAGGDTLRVRTVLARGADRARSSLAGQPNRLATALTVLGSVYHTIGLYPEADDLLSEAKDLRDVAGSAAERAETLYYLSETRMELGDVTEAEGLLDEALRTYRALIDEPDTTYADGLMQHAYTLRWTGQFARAESLYAEIEGLQRRLRGADARAVTEAHIGRLDAIAQQTDRATEAAEALDALAEIAEGDVRIHALDAAASAYAQANNPRAAVERARAALNEYDSLQAGLTITLGDLLGSLGAAQISAGQYTAADSAYTAAYAIYVQFAGAESAYAAAGLADRAESLAYLKRLDEAEAAGRESLALFRTYLSPGHYYRAYAHVNLARSLLGQRQEEEARLHLDTALVLRRTAFGDTHKSVRDVEMLLEGSDPLPQNF